MINDNACGDRRKFGDRLPFDIRFAAKKCRGCKGPEKLDPPIPVSKPDTPPRRSEAAENAPRDKAAENRLEGRRKPDCGPGPESAGPGNTNEPTPGEGGSAAAPAAVTLAERVLTIHKNAWINLVACIDAGKMTASRDYAASLCVLVEILRLMNLPHGNGANLKGESDD